ncbi:tyrosine-type recombinase/integrase [Puerhibacterium sp. TATVAM-FAB25]|uniref:tyrosine-type recombinase/integrase n=1 Tax=Puerhibacterium sp. TATVAM-FAB25 TaxID=3093699 RepID=UPI00397D04FF
MTAGRPRHPLGSQGEISVAPHGNGWRARTRLRGLDGRVRAVSATGASERAARAALREKIAGLLREVGHEQTVRGVTVSRAARDWYDHEAADGRLRPQTLEGYLRLIRREIVPRLGGLELGELTVRRLEEEIGAIVATGQRNKAEKVRGLLVQILGRAERLDLVRGNPAARTSTVRKPVPDPKALTIEEIAAVREAVRTWRANDGERIGKRPTGSLPVGVDLMLGTGMRIGEALALLWRNVHLDDDVPTVEVEATLVQIKARWQKVARGEPAYDEAGREVQVRWSPNPRAKGRFVRDAAGEWVQVGGGLIRQPQPKSRTGERVIVLPRFAADELRRWRPARWDPEAPVFPTGSGGFTSPNNYRSALRASLRAAGIDPESFHPHLLRSTVATAIARSREHGVEAAAVLGHHASLVTTKHYVERLRSAPDVTSALDGLVAALPTEGEPRDKRAPRTGWIQPTFDGVF